VIELLASTLRLSTPLLFAALGGLLCERSGIATICLEGVMLVSAFTAATVDAYTHDPALSLVVGMMAGALTMALHAFLSITTRADQIVSGVAVNLFAAGITPILTKAFFGSPTNTQSLEVADRFQPWDFGNALFNQPTLVYLALALPFFLHFTLYRTRFGLRLLAAGDGPESLLTAGVSFRKVRWKALLLGGAIASLGGTYLSIAHASQFTRDMTAGRGYIALTALIFGKWRPIPTLFACLFFGLADASQIQLQSMEWNGGTVPVQAIQALPYVVTLLVLVGFVGKSQPPLAIGRRE